MADGQGWCIMSRKFAILFVGAALGAGCSQTAKQISPAAQQPDNPVIGRLVGRDNTITILSSPSGVLYSVQDRNGVMLLRDVGEQELRARLPEVYQQIKSSVSVGIVDARLVAD
jgi:hypothetical protein